MFERVRRVRSAVRFVQERIPRYGPVITEDLRRFRLEIVAATVGAGMAAVASLMFACFVSVAVIVTVWDSHYRVLVAWLITGFWALVSLFGLLYARRAVVGPLPFRLTAAAMSRDYEHLLGAVSGTRASGKQA
jgi:hypothetical protein